MNDVQALKTTLILTLIITAAYIVVKKTLFEGLVFFLFGFLALYLWLFIECCWTENEHSTIQQDAHHRKKGTVKTR